MTRRNDVGFGVGPEDLPGVVRFYGSFSDAALESGASRIYAGLHFMPANVNGLTSGAATGGYVARHFLRPKGGRRH
jgi:hypothetical protein